MACTKIGDTPKRKPTSQYTIDYSFVYEKDNEEGSINLSQSCKYWYNKLGDKLFGKSQIGSGSITQCSKHFPLLTERDTVFFITHSPGLANRISRSGGHIVWSDTGLKTNSGISFYDETENTNKHKSRTHIRLGTIQYNYFFDRDNYNKGFKTKLESFPQLKGATFKRVEARLRAGVFEAPDWADTNTNKK